MSEAPKTRRWFRFSLRTLFVVVALVSVWLGLYVQAVHARRETKAWIVKLGGVISDTSCAPLKLQQEKNARFPEHRRWFGDEPAIYISLVHTHATWEQRERVARLFPEAWVVPVRADGFRPADSQAPH